jgi:enoyl-CoA hydratase
MEKSGQCIWEIKDNIGVLTIDNPPQNLLIDPEFVETSTFLKWTASKDIKGLIIMGNGRNFSAGADKENLYKNAENKKLMQEQIKKGTELLQIIEGLEIPTIAAIKGACFGGGLEIALACHIRVASDKAMFALPESELNLMPGLNGILRLPKLISASEALKLILSGDIIDAETALKLKLVDYVTTSDNVFNYSFNLIKHMTENKRIEVINYIIKSFNNFKTLNFEKAMEEEMKMFCDLAYNEAKRKNGMEN